MADVDAGTVRISKIQFTVISVVVGVIGLGTAGVGNVFSWGRANATADDVKAAIRAHNEILDERFVNRQDMPDIVSMHAPWAQDRGEVMTRLENSEKSLDRVEGMVATLSSEMRETTTAFREVLVELRRNP